MKSSYRYLLGSLLFLAACSSHEKKIIIYASGKVQADESQKNIVLTEGNTHVEQALNFTGSAPVILNITGPKGNYTLTAGEDGLYLANLRNDTIVGSLQHTGSERQGRLTQEQLTFQLDSLIKLVKGVNISAAAKNYFIVPGKMERISSFTNAKIFGPFTPVPAGFDAGSVPEIYKFYKIAEMNVIISKLTEMSKYKYQSGDEKKDQDDDDSVHTIHPTGK